MRVNLKGVHTVRKRLAGGQVGTYRYAWRGGPRLLAEPGSPAFIREFEEAHRQRRVPRGNTFGTLVAEYRASSAFMTLRDRTRKDYARYLKMVETDFGDLPIAALSDQRMRGDFMVWRDKMIESPRTADLAWSVLARVLSVAVDRGRILTNPCERGGRLYKADRQDAIWTEEMVETALAAFPESLRWALVLAIWTGQRQGDLLRLPWSAYNGDHIRLRQSKTGTRVKIKVSAALKAELHRIPKIGTLILTNQRKLPWSSDGFRTSWGRACAKAGITGVTFHDLRGSAITRLAEAGATPQEIAAVTGHSLNDVNAMLDAHYMSRTGSLSDSGIRKLERKEKRTKSVNRSVNQPSRGSLDDG